MKTYLIHFLIFISIASCNKKSDDIIPGGKKEGALTMNINGKAWKGNCGDIDFKDGSKINVTIVSSGHSDESVTINMIDYIGNGSYSSK